MAASTVITSQIATISSFIVMNTKLCLAPVLRFHAEMECSPHSLTSHKTVKVHEAEADSCRYKLQTRNISLIS